MDAEASHPDVLAVGVLKDELVCVGWDYRGTSDETRRCTHAVDFQIRDVKTQIEVLGDVPLGAGANKPARPVVVAAKICNRLVAYSAVAIALQHTKDVVRLVVVAHRSVAAIERRAPPWGPEVLIPRLDAPSRSQIDRGCSPVQRGAPIDAVGHNAVGRTKAILYPPVIVRILGTGSVEHLGCRCPAAAGSRPG
jgi:hypothetical protein